MSAKITKVDTVKDLTPLDPKDFVGELQEDLGMQLVGNYRARMVLVKCTYCNRITKQYANNAKKSKLGRCGSCVRVKALDPAKYPIKLLEDLGLYRKEGCTNVVRYASFECPSCCTPYTTSSQDVRTGSSTMCKSCSLKLSGWTDSEWEYRGKASRNFVGFSVYILELQSPTETFYKIGKTYIGVEGRMSREKMPYTYRIIKLINTSSGKETGELERALHKTHKELQYVPETLFNGYTECFSEINHNEVDKMIRQYKKDEVL